VTDFAAATERLITQVRHWEQPRWSAPAGPGTKADATYALVQRLADLSADADDRPHRTVPREHDLILPDQLRVMADDLLAANPAAEVLTEATTELQTLRALL
jgi:hypothetical protein